VHLILERAFIRRAHVLGTFHGDGAIRYSGGVASRIDAARAFTVSADFSPGR